MMGSLALFALTLAAGCGGGGGYSSTPTTTPTTTQPPAGGLTALTITVNGQNGNMSFSPNPATVKVGQKVSWRNADSITHAIVQDAGESGDPYGGGGNGFSTGNLGTAATSDPLTMRAAGSTGYHCGIHPSMVGVLTVTQ